MEEQDIDRQLTQAITPIVLYYAIHCMLITPCIIQWIYDCSVSACLRGIVGRLQSGHGRPHQSRVSGCVRYMIVQAGSVQY
jgi:hypothetical protein